MADVPDRNIEEVVRYFGEFPFRTEMNLGDQLELKVFRDTIKEPLNDDTNIFGVLCTVARELDEEFEHGPANSGEIVFRVTFEPR